MGPEIKLIIVAFVTVTIGSVVRILHENEKEKIKSTRVAFMYFCSLAIGYLCYTLANIYDKHDWLGFAGILGGIISVDLVNLIIEHLPELIRKKFTKKFEDDNSN